MSLEGKKVSELARTSVANGTDLLVLDNGGAELQSIYVDDIFGNSTASSKVSKSGDTMTGTLAIESNGSKNLVIRNTSANTQTIVSCDQNNNTALTHLDIASSTVYALYLNSSQSFKPYFRQVNNFYPLVYVVEQYRNGNDWYILYSTGRLEQGGVTTGNGTYGYTNVTLLKSFADTNYTVLGNIQWPSSAWYTSGNAAGQAALTDVVTSPCDKTTSGFKLQSFTPHTWMAVGWAA